MNGYKLRSTCKGEGRKEAELSLLCHLKCVPQASSSLLIFNLNNLPIFIRTCLSSSNVLAFFDLSCLGKMHFFSTYVFFSLSTVFQHIFLKEISLLSDWRSFWFDSGFVIVVNILLSKDKKKPGWRKMHFCWMFLFFTKVLVQKWVLNVLAIMVMSHVCVCFCIILLLCVGLDQVWWSMKKAFKFKREANKVYQAAQPKLSKLFAVLSVVN